jgi:hypothetical protein
MNEPDNCTVLVAQNSLYDVGHPQLSQIGIRLYIADRISPFTSRHAQTIQSRT